MRMKKISGTMERGERWNRDLNRNRKREGEEEEEDDAPIR